MATTDSPFSRVVTQFIDKDASSIVIDYLTNTEDRTIKNFVVELLLANMYLKNHPREKNLLPSEIKQLQTYQQ